MIGHFRWRKISLTKMIDTKMIGWKQNRTFPAQNDRSFWWLLTVGGIESTPIIHFESTPNSKEPSTSVEKSIDIHSKALLRVLKELPEF